MQRDEIIKLIEEAARTGQTELNLRGNQLSELKIFNFHELASCFSLLLTTLSFFLFRFEY